MIKKRGSAILFVMVFLLAITTVLLASAVLGTSGIEYQSRLIQKAQAQAAFDGAIDQTVCDLKAGTVSTFPATKNITLGSITVALTILDNSSHLASSVEVDGSMTIGGHPYSFKRIIGNRRGASPFFFALVSGTSLDMGGNRITTGAASANGDTAINGSLTGLSGSSVFNGNLQVTGIITSGGITVTGTKTTGAPAINIPSQNPADYTGAATFTIGASHTINGFAFTSPASGLYQLAVINAPGTLSGVLSGNGVIYVNGNLSIPNNVTYSSAADHVAIIVNGNINIGGSVSQLAGYYYCTGSFNFSSNLTVTRGCLIFHSATPNSRLTVIGDPFVPTDPTQGPRLRLPGMYP